MHKAIALLADGSRLELPLLKTESSVILKRTDVPAGTRQIALLPDRFAMQAGAEGYYMVPSVDDEGHGHCGLIEFVPRDDQESRFRAAKMPLYLCCRGDHTAATLVVVCGMELDYELVVSLKEGVYTIYPNFLLDGEAPDEDIELKFFELSGDDACWQGAARRYRRYQLERGACIPLAERAKRHPVVGEAALGPEVRIRLAWKPVPSPVPEQTEETEPPLHVAITFEQCGKIIDEFHRQGIQHAEFCLVGWNKSGHDGRFPDLLPVEPLLGGEEELLKVVKKAREYGYLICAHTNLLDSYSIAKRWRREYCLGYKDGIQPDEGCWGGGRSHRLCPQMAHQAYAEEDMALMQRLGFRGTHYLDVMSIVIPPKCYDPRHPLTRKEAARWRGKTLALAREKVGASGSEGAWDFCIGDFDYALYTVFHKNGKDERPMVTRHVPFWQIVYHGIIHYNTCCDTVNSAIKSDPSLSLYNLAWGGRPAAYFHAKFLTTGRNWMGNEDLYFTTPEQLARDVAKLKQEYERFAAISDLQFHFMEDYREPAQGIAVVTYDNGTRLRFNMTATPWTAPDDGTTLPPFSMERQA